MPESMPDDEHSVVADEPAWSPRRALRGVRWWLWWRRQEGTYPIAFWLVVRYFHRPHEQHQRRIY